MFRLYDDLSICMDRENAGKECRCPKYSRRAVVHSRVVGLTPTEKQTLV